MKVAILGFGTVGSSVARILCDLQPSGLSLTHVFNRGVARKKVDWAPASVTWTEDFETVLRSDVDVVVELAGGLEPAGTWVRRALDAGKSAVTGNKKLIAAQGIELDRLARSKGAHLLYGAAVAGGIPVIPGLQQGLAGDRITRIEGILNGTCNYMLSRMETGAAFADVLADAQRLGYAEANPSEDVDGYDARAKLVILARIALRAGLDVESVECRSITQVDAVDLVYARDLGCTIRQISKAELANGGVSALVGPMLVPLRSPLAWSRGTENMVLVSGQYGGDVVFSGHGAGGHPTAVAVVSDLISLAHGSRPVDLPSQPTPLSGEFELRHYIRFVVKDSPGIVAEIAGALAAEKINIDALFQRPGYEKTNLPFVVTTEPCAASGLRRALDRVKKAAWLAQPPLDLPMLGE
ncbi:MAG TPA: homoserine dehydrogenase [Acidobacteriaceae bacterium]|nr:homoserine dehydrogenase [Acidobacteriaceae bacterium]